MIETVDEASVSANGIEIKIDQVFVETGMIYLSFALSSTDPAVSSEGISPSTSGSIHIEDEDNPSWLNCDISPLPADHVADQVAFATMICETIATQDYSQTKNLRVRLSFSDITYYIPEPFQVLTIKGPWNFDFIADGTQLAQQTRSYALDQVFYEDEKEYRLTQLVVSPIRARIEVVRENPIVWSSMLDEDWVEQEYYFDSTNLRGFTLRDAENHTVQFSEPSWQNYAVPITFIFYTQRNDNPWEWLKDASSVEVTPYAVSLTDWHPEKTGLERYWRMESFTINLDNGWNQ